jgi:hypothetical protein
MVDLCSGWVFHLVVQLYADTHSGPFAISNRRFSNSFSKKALIPLTAIGEFQCLSKCHPRVTRFRLGDNALACFIRSSGPCNEEDHNTDDEVSLEAMRRLVDICGVGSQVVATTYSYTHHHGSYEVMQHADDMLTLAAANTDNVFWYSLTAQKLLVNAAVQEYLSLDEPDGAGITKLHSVIRYMHFSQWSTTLRIFLAAGASPDIVRKSGRGLLHLILSPMGACNDYEMPNGLFQELVDLLVMLVAVYGCDPLLADDGGMTPFDGSLAPVAWSVWCRALNQAGRNIEEDLNTLDVRMGVVHNEVFLAKKYQAALDMINKDTGDWFYEDDLQEQSDTPCRHCGKTRQWQLRRAPFDHYGTYRPVWGDGSRYHYWSTNHLDSSYCSNVVTPGTCCAKEHKGSQGPPALRSSAELSWRRHVAYMLWRDGYLNTPLQAQLTVSGFGDAEEWHGHFARTGGQRTTSFTSTKQQNRKHTERLKDASETIRRARNWGTSSRTL